jgi:hypothetical protein
MSKRTLLALAIEEVNDEIEAAAAAAAPAVDPAADPAADLATTLEQDPAADPAAAEPVAEEPLVSEGDEAAVAEITEDTEVLGDNLDQVDEVAKDEQALDSISTAVAGAAEEGGLSPAAAQVVEIAVERISERLGLKSRVAMIATEAYAVPRNRVLQTKRAAENIQEKAKEIFALIVSFFKKIGAWLKEFFAKVFGNVGALKAAAEKALAAAKTSQGGGGTIKKQGFVYKLVNPDMPKFDPATVLGNLGQLKEVTEKTLVGIAAFGASAVKDFEVVKEKGADAVTFDATMGGAFQPNPFAELRGNSGFGVVVAGGYFGFTFAGGDNKSSLWNLKALNNSQFHNLAVLVHVFDAIGDTIPDELPALTAPQAQQVASAVIELANSLESRKQALDSVLKAIAGITSAAEHAAQGANEQEGENVRGMKNLYTRIGNCLSKLPSGLVSMNLHAGFAALKYVQASLGNQAALPGGRAALPAPTK